MQNHPLTKLHIDSSNSSSTLQAVMDLFETKADQLYVIMDKAGTTVLKDPGLDRPWATTNLKIAEHVVKDIPNGRVVTLKHAVDTILKHNIDKSVKNS